MKILVLAPQPFYIDRGTPIDVDLLVRALCQRGDDVHLLAYPHGHDRNYPGLSIHRVKAPSWCATHRPGFSLAKLVCDVFMFFQAIALTRQIRPDVIHAGEEAAFMAMYIQRTLGVPYVYDMDSSIAQQLVEQRPWLTPLARPFSALEAKAIRSAIATAPVCHALADLARQRGAAHVTTLHDISQLRDDDMVNRHVLDDKLDRSRDVPVMLYVGNLEPYQGVDLLLRSMRVAQHQGAKVQLVIAGGQAADIARYEQISQKLGIDECTHFIGHWPADRLGELLMEADILVAPRIRGINTPMKIFPYLHTGRAVLVTDLPTHSQVLDDTVAMLAPAEPEGFGRAIAKLAADPQLRKRLGLAGRAFAQREHTYEAHYRRVQELYEFVAKVIDRSSVSAPSQTAEAVLEKST